MASQLSASDATIVTRHPPDIDRNALIVAICAVPLGREGKEDLGHHVADFLAWKTLYASSSANPKNQAWLAQTDLAAAVQTHGYHHSGRDISAAATDSDHPIVIESNPQALVGRFMKALAQKVEATHDHNDPLVVILCGLTSLEQDLFVVDGEDYVATITSTCIRAFIGENIRVTLINPSMSSAGWQVNPSFMSADNPRTTKIEFLARQCGTLFSPDIVAPFYSEDSPILKGKADGGFAVPIMKSPQLKAAEAALHEKIYARLSGRFVVRPNDHSFCFDSDNDPWQLIGARTGIPLTKLAQHWNRLSKVDAQKSSLIDHYHFLGNAFGGSRKSQLAHIEHMFRLSLLFPGFCSVTKDQNIQHFDRLKCAAKDDETKCHILFNVLDYRMTLMVLGNMVPETLGWSVSPTVKCRDWNEGVWTGRTEGYNKKLVTDAWTHCLEHVCPVGMPYGRHIGQLKGLFIPLSGPTRYMAALMAAQCSGGQELTVRVAAIRDLIHKIKAYQTKLLCADSEVQDLSSAWADCCRRDTNGPMNLSPLAPKFVPSTRLEQSEPRATIQPPSPVKQDATQKAVEPAFGISNNRESTANRAVTPVTREQLHDQRWDHRNDIRDSEQKTADRSDDFTRPERPPASIQPAFSYTEEAFAIEDDQTYLPPHLQTRPVQTLQATVPVERAFVPPPTTPDKQDWNVVEPITSEQQQQQQLPTSAPPLNHRSTPPHLRGANTLNSIPSIRYR